MPSSPLHPLCLAIVLALPVPALADAPVGDAMAATGARTAAGTELDRVVVTATRTAREIADVPATVSAIGRSEMDAMLARDLDSLFRYEPGVTVTRDVGRFGIGDVRIRGLGGNRVRLQTDGIAVSDAFSIGSYSNANRNFVDPDTLKAVEVVRGPASALYGSDALGGVVAFITRDPDDYVDGRGAYLGVKLGHDGASKGLFGTLTSAFAGDRWSGLVVVGHHQGRETGNQGKVGGTGSARTEPNPQRRDGRSLLTKLVFDVDPRHRLRLTVEGNDAHVDTEVLSSLGYSPMTGATTTSLTGHDLQSRVRASLDWEATGIDAMWADAFQLKLHRQDSETTQDTAEARRLASGIAQTRLRSFNFDQREIGLQGSFFKSFATGRADHALTYGIEATRDRVRQKRDGRVLQAGSPPSPVMPPDVFPVRDFPNSETTNAALYLQDEIGLAGGRLTVVPGVRVDHYRLSPKVDPIFAGDNPGVAVESLEETQVSPKLGLVWRFGEGWSGFASYAQGFRAPPYNDVNLGFTNLQFGYTAIPNPDLASETSEGLELGLRYASDAVSASLSAYYNRYDDFIESLRFVGFDDRGLMVFQSRNVDDARIRGVEFSGGVELGRLADRLDGWSLRGAATWAKGEDRTDGTPLATVDPLRATLGLAYDTPAWGVELAGRFAARKRDLPGDADFATPGHGVLDLLAHWEFAPGATFNAGVFNLADRTYWETGSLPAGTPTASVALDRYTAPGRYLGLSLSVHWQ